MLVLKRRPGQQILLAGTIRITILNVRRASVELGIEAPLDTPILRGELESVEQGQQLPEPQTTRVL